jgi:hypothetical protein
MENLIAAFYSHESSSHHVMNPEEYLTKAGVKPSQIEVIYHELHSGSVVSEERAAVLTPDQANALREFTRSEDYRHHTEQDERYAINTSPLDQFQQQMRDLISELQAGQNNEPQIEFCERTLDALNLLQNKLMQPREAEHSDAQRDFTSRVMSSFVERDEAQRK